MTKYVFGTGGVVSSLGKGIASASLAAINGEIAVHYVASATYSLIEFLTALAPVLPSPTSPTVELHPVEPAWRIPILA